MGFTKKNFATIYTNDNKFIINYGSINIIGVTTYDKLKQLSSISTDDGKITCEDATDFIKSVGRVFGRVAV